jgi:glycosyltransferase involved in cell wall biosynthesis
MRVIFLSNFLNHHQLPLAQAFQKQGAKYTFVASDPVPQERLSMGYQDMNDMFPFVLKDYGDPEQSRLVEKAIQSADVIILGSSRHDYFEHCGDHQAFFRYSERIFKNGEWRFRLNPRNRKDLRSVYQKYPNCWLLAAGQYAANDFSLVKAYEGKMLKWGYFPEAKTYSNGKEEDSSLKEILWTGRMIPFKHPEIAVRGARYLRDHGIHFHMTMVGDGPLRGNIEKEIAEIHLESEITLSSSLPYDQVREYMENSDIFLFTSDRGEGWGAVLNEAMNSGCACLADKEAGATGFLIRDGENGLIYEDGNEKQFLKKLEKLAGNPQLCRWLGQNAYHTITELWNADTAAARVLKFSENLLQGNEPVFYPDGPLSIAETVPVPLWRRIV